MNNKKDSIVNLEKVMSGIKKTDSIMFDGYQIYHNYTRPHIGLNSKTPAQACGIDVNGNNKGLTLIHNASQ